jgi:predicted AlkP superfamily phosphohydrolase/phosphomutase
MKPKVVVIGLDGATFNLIKPWAEKGLLPNLRGLMEHGTAGELTSVIPPETAGAWFSFKTGMSPGKHGVYGFTQRSGESYQEIPVDSRSSRHSPFWNLLGKDGKRVMILNLPTTYPAQPVNGAMITGFMTASHKRHSTYPESLLQEIEAKFGEYPFFVKALLGIPKVALGKMSHVHIDAFLNSFLKMMELKFKVAHYLLEKDHFDFVFIHEWGVDRICHDLWEIIDEDFAHVAGDAYDRFRAKAVQYFQKVDEEIGKLAQRMDDGGCLFVISDHGFGPMDTFINLPVWLYREGYLKFKAQPATRLKLFLWEKGIIYFVYRYILQRLMRLVARVFAKGTRWSLTGERALRMLSSRSALISQNDIDWERTRAFCPYGCSQIIINLEGREHSGIVKPGKEYEELRGEIIGKLRSLVDPDTGKAVNGTVAARDEVYQGEFFKWAPDIVFLPFHQRYCAGNFMGFLSNKAFSDSGDYGMYSFHRMEGIFLAKGPSIREGAWIEGASIVDMAPTLLYLMGSKIPKNMDGKVLTGMFNDSFLKENPIQFAEETEEDRRAYPETGEEDKEEVLKRLKGLGYIE